MDQIDQAYVLQSEETIAHLSAKVKLQDQRIQEFLKNGGKYAEEMAKLREAVKAVDPYPRVSYKAGDPSSSPISPVILWSDWQIGEVIDDKETDGWGVFNFAKAEDRVFENVARVLDWTTMHRRAGYQIDDLHVFSIGDLVSGNIHYELEVTNEFPVTVATAKAAALFAEAIARLAAHFKSVTVWEMSADNHGRLTKKNQWKQGAKNNFSYLTHVIANQTMKNLRNVTPILGEGVQLLATVQGKKFLLTHGHAIKSQMGIPFYGLERMRGREAQRRMGTDKEFDYIAVGHFHTDNKIGNILMNGSLPGTTEMDHGMSRHAPPSQVSFMCHPKHGIFDLTSWRLK